MRTLVEVQREIFRMVASNLHSDRAIARHLGITHKTVKAIRVRYLSCGVDANNLLKMNDEDFVRNLGTKNKSVKSTGQEPDWQDVHKEMARPDVTRKLLWEEYWIEGNEASEKFMTYPTFSRKYKEWLKSRRISMRQIHKPGEKMFVDFCGRTVPVFQNENQKIISAQVFVAVLGGSGYTFAYAVESQKIRDWIECNVKALEFFGGVPSQIIPDNLKSAVIKNTFEAIELNRSYSEMADYYGVIINPARSRKPKDKPLAEVGVQIVQRWLLSALRNHKFFSIEDLNKEIQSRLITLNNKITKTYPESRAVRFLDTEKPFLRELPDIPFERSEWRYSVRVPSDYHVQYDNAFYSVPYIYRNQKVDLRINKNSIEVFINVSRVASHLFTGKKINTKPEHLAPEHKEFADNQDEALITWAESIGQFTTSWVKRNLNRKDFINGRKTIMNLKRWVGIERNYDRLESGCRFALDVNLITCNDLKSIITNKRDLHKPIINTNKIRLHENIRGSSYYSLGEDETC